MRLRVVCGMLYDKNDGELVSHELLPAKPIGHDGLRVNIEWISWSWVTISDPLLYALDSRLITRATLYQHGILR